MTNMVKYYTVLYTVLHGKYYCAWSYAYCHLIDKKGDM